MFGIGIQELGIILVVALLVFGPKRLPELARTLGRGMGEFRRASNELRQSLSLDEVQNELRNATRIHEPTGPPKPDQRAAPAPPAASPTGAATDSSPAAPTAPPPPKPHPGELPLGNDHEHHAVPEDDEEASAHDTRAQRTGAADRERG